MAFNKQEQEIIKWGINNGKSQSEIEAAIGSYRLGITNQQGSAANQPIVADTTPQPSIGQRVSNVVTGAGRKVQEAISGEGEFAGQTPVRRGFEAAGEAAKAVPGVAIASAPGPVRTALGKVGDLYTKTVDFLGDKISDIPAFTNFVNKNPEAARVIEEIAGTTEAAGEVSGTVLLGQGAATGATKASAATKAAAVNVTNKIRQTRPLTQNLINQTSELISPSPTPAAAVGQVIQGKTGDLPRGVKAFNSLDTTNVQTYAQLQTRINSKIGELSGVVDDVLARDGTRYSLPQLVTKTKTTSGRTISRNYVSDALEHLKELYTKTADDVRLAQVDDLIKQAEKGGLTRLEVNDIARLYGIEFGQKAFSKVTGEPLTSVNAQKYENIRSGLKDTARQGMQGTEAAAIDQTISSLYNTRALVSKNVEAVNKLKQKIAERGLFEQIGNQAAKYADILTGGSIRGLVGGLLPRGAGYKTLNALDLEAQLAKNLQIIRDALKTSSEAELIKAVKQLDVGQ